MRLKDDEQHLRQTLTTQSYEDLIDNLVDQFEGYKRAYSGPATVEDNEPIYIDVPGLKENASKGFRLGSMEVTRYFIQIFQSIQSKLIRY